MNEINSLSPKGVNDLQSSIQQRFPGDTVNLGEVFAIIKAQRKIIFLVILSVFVIAFFYTLFMPTQYESTTLIQVENKSGGTVDNMLKSLSVTTDNSNNFSANINPLNIEEVLISSRFILQPTIESLGLNIQIEPRYFPIFGNFIAHRNSGQNLAKPFFGLSNYAWGGEKVIVKQFVVPHNFFDKKFILKINSNNSYTLYSADRDLLIKGTIGKLAESKDSGIIPGVKILVSLINANPGVEYLILSKPIDKILKKIKDNLTITDLGLQNDNTNGGQKSETGVLSLSLKGTDAEQLPLILNAITYNDIQKNISKKTAESQKTLIFLEHQSIILKDELDKAENTLSKYKSKQGALGVSAANQVLLNQMVELEKSVAEIKLKKAQLLQDFTEQHPYIIGLNEQQEKLKQELFKLEQEVRTLPKTEQKILSLEREVKVKNDLYYLILSKIQQLQIIKEGTISDVRTLDPATPPVKSPSKVSVILLGSVLFGFVLSLIIVFLRRIFAQHMDDPDYIEECLGIPLYAVIPHSKNQKQISKDIKQDLLKQNSSPFILANLYSKDLAIEGLRSLCTILLISLKKTKNNIITILGADPNIGKSFVSINLAYVFANSGKKVLLIDADLRRGKIHSCLLQNACPGLAEILGGTSTFEEAKRSLKDVMFANTHSGGVDCLTCGKYPNNPVELLRDYSFEQFINMVSPRYDIVIIDTPPVLVATDANIIAKYADNNLLLVGSKTENIRTLQHTVGRLKKHNISVQGLIFNNNTKSLNNYSYGYDYYVHS